ncbi:MAG: hypothetical protein HOQ01_03955, partial [Lysobacter sp.]|nr:hypothetical protein [Lysobacter sp.]
MQIRKQFLCGAAVLSLLSLAGHVHAYDSNRIVVKFRDGSVARMQPAMALRTLAPGAQSVQRLGDGAQVLRVGKGQADATIAKLSKHRDVQYAARDLVLQRVQAAVPDDPWYRSY